MNISWWLDARFVVSVALALFLLSRVGNWLCGKILSRSGLIAAMQAKADHADAVAATAAAAATAANAPPAPPLRKDHPKVGSLIGTFERLLIAGGVLTGSWEILAAVVALKTVARFKELDEKLDAEYFLVGSLFSIVWAVLITFAWIGFDHFWGYDLLATLRTAKH